MARWTVLAALIALPLGGSVARQPDDPRAPIRAAAIPLDRGDPSRVRVGALRYLGGWQLSSDNPRFGGISSMVADGTGGFIAETDEGSLIRFRIDAAGRISDSDIAYLPGAGPGIEKAANDVESIARDPATGALWLGYEGRNMIRRLDPAGRKILAETKPRAMQRWPGNTGAESLERLADGRFLVISEDAPRPDGAKQALLFPGDPTDPRNRPLRFGYRPPPHFLATDARQLPDGRVLVLNRRFNLIDGVGAAVTVLDPRTIRSGAVVPSRQIARLERPLAVDNMEALAVTREGGRTILWMASDDNFSWLQRTLLMKFALEE